MKMKTFRMTKQFMDEIKRRQNYFRGAILKWASMNLREFPWRRDRTPYKVLVAEIILRRTTSKAALKVYEGFLQKWPDIISLSKANPTELEEFLKAVGYHKQRAAILIEMAKYIMENYGGRIPAHKEDLLRIPHVGFYTASAILSLGYGVRAAMVDSNVQRILKRYFQKYLPERLSTKLIQEIADFLVPEENHEIYNLALLDLGALICRYNKPRCDRCPLQSTCDIGKNMLKEGY